MQVLKLGSGRSLSLKGTFAPAYSQGTGCYMLRGDCVRFPRGTRILTMVAKRPSLQSLVKVLFAKMFLNIQNI